MIKGLVVDVDDTLYLEREYVRSGFAAVDAWVRSELGIEGVGAHAWSLFERGVRGTTLTDAIAAAGAAVTPELRSRVISVYREHDPDIGLLPDAENFLAREAKALPIAVVTDGPAVSQRAKCRALGLVGIARFLLVTDEQGTSKPDPVVFRAVEHELGLTGRELLWVADNPVKDFVTPQRLGWATVRVRRLGSLHRALATPPGVLEVADLSRLSINLP